MRGRISKLSLNNAKAGALYTRPYWSVHRRLAETQDLFTALNWAGLTFLGDLPVSGGTRTLFKSTIKIKLWLSGFHRHITDGWAETKEMYDPVAVSLPEGLQTPQLIHYGYLETDLTPESEVTILTSSGRTVLKAGQCYIKDKETLHKLVGTEFSPAKTLYVLAPPACAGVLKAVMLQGALTDMAPVLCPYTDLLNYLIKVIGNVTLGIFEIKFTAHE